MRIPRPTRVPESRGRAFAGALGALVIGVTGLVTTAPPTQAAAPQIVLPATSPYISVATTNYWNDTLLEIYRRQGGGPGPLARGAAMLHGALFDVGNSVKNNAGPQSFVYGSAFGTAIAPQGVDVSLAADLTARAVLTDAFPAQAAYIQQRYAARSGTTTQAAATTLSDGVIALVRNNRANDGSSATPGYTAGTTPGAWRPTGGGCTTAVDPQWGTVKPFAMTSSSQARQPLPGGYQTYSALLASTLYANNVNEVKALGSRTSTTRTSAQTGVAFFWANDANGTYKPPGQLLAHTRAVVDQSTSLDPLERQRDFALVSFALADAGIAAWDQKYDTPIDLWRPVTAIQRAGEDGNAATAADPYWQPLAPSTPCFPSWVSGHATFAGAWAGVMNSLFGSSRSFTGGTEDGQYTGAARTYTSFSQAATENARSRVYLGVHYQFDADDGLATGAAVAQQTLTRMRKTNCPNLCS